jgi:PLP dependent protein
VSLEETQGANEGLSQRLAGVKARIAAAEVASSREPGSVKLVCVSKTHPASAIREAYALGERRFGESYAKELFDKAAELVDLPDIEWHFIGHLQSNKAKLVAKVAHVVHSVDSPVLAKELARRYVAAGRFGEAMEGPVEGAAPIEVATRHPLRVLLEVNIGGEAQKHGVAPAELPELLLAARAEPALRVVGLMAMPPADDLNEAKRVFSTLRTLRNLVAEDLPDLSMGMSGDLEVAVDESATYVRVGTSIFGPRE